MVESERRTSGKLIRSSLQSMRLLPILELEKWNPNQLKNVVAEIYRSKGYSVEDMHGRNEKGIDLLATRKSIGSNDVIESIGIQVTKEKVGKKRVENATYALSHGDAPQFFMLYTPRGVREDFDSYVKGLKKDMPKRIIVMSGPSFEREILATGSTPDWVFEGLVNSFYRTPTFQQIIRISKIITSSSKRSPSNAEIANLVSHHAQVEFELRGLMRAFQDLQTNAGKTLGKLLASGRNDEAFILAIREGFDSLQKPFSKVERSLVLLSNYPLALRMFWLTFAGTHRGWLSRPQQSDGWQGVKDFWLLSGFDPEDSVLRNTFGRDLAIAAFHGLERISQYLKGYVDHVLSFDLSNAEALKKAISGPWLGH